MIHTMIKKVLSHWCKESGRTLVEIEKLRFWGDRARYESSEKIVLVYVAY